ncbi:MAG TPA: DUF58 domain-containing protein, partial [Candidatus Bathyarchaeia archaeon]|nr:DUF58 domain-containing protein [Candidatus Bathyarchaeia archaeon]
QGKGTDIGAAVEYLSKVTTRRTVAFLISDFFDPGAPKKESSYRKALAIAAKRHDLIAVPLSDPAESHWKGRPMFLLEDAETGQLVTIDPRANDFAKRYAMAAVDRNQARTRLFRSLGMDEIPVSTDGAYADEIVKFFLKRKGRR